MSGQEWQHSPEKPAKKPESIFPLDYEAVEPYAIAYATSSSDILQMVTKARGVHGPADDLYLNLPKEELVWFQMEQGWIYSDDGELQYRVGLLYGLDMAQNTRSRRRFEPELKADNPEALEKAIDYIKQSYELKGSSKWNAQIQREQHFMGTDSLLTMNALLTQSIAEKLGGTYSSSNIVEGMVLYGGMIDGALLVDAYDSYRRGAEPQPAREMHKS